MKAARLLTAGAIAALLPVAGAFAQSTASPQDDPPSQPPQGTQQGATFESLDLDKDGRISKTEAAANANVSQQFSKYDQNGDGFIERQEVTTANTKPQTPGK